MKTYGLISECAPIKLSSTLAHICLQLVIDLPNKKVHSIKMKILIRIIQNSNWSFCVQDRPFLCRSYSYIKLLSLLVVNNRTIPIFNKRKKNIVLKTNIQNTNKFYEQIINNNFYHKIFFCHFSTRMFPLEIL